jgi:hypothetical protein
MQKPVAFYSLGPSMAIVNMGAEDIYERHAALLRPARNRLRDS